MRIEGSVEAPDKSLCATFFSSAARAKEVQELHGLPLTQVDICPKILPKLDQGDSFCWPNSLVMQNGHGGGHKTPAHAELSHTTAHGCQVPSD